MKDIKLDWCHRKAKELLLSIFMAPVLCRFVFCGIPPKGLLHLLCPLGLWDEHWRGTLRHQDQGRGFTVSSSAQKSTTTSLSQSCPAEELPSDIGFIWTQHGQPEYLVRPPILLKIIEKNWLSLSLELLDNTSIMFASFSPSPLKLVNWLLIH